MKPSKVIVVGTRLPKSCAPLLSNACLMFVGLKLANFIDWSWWAVFAPLMVGVVIAVIQESVQREKYAKEDATP